MIHIWSDVIEWHQNISVVKLIIKLFKEPQSPLTHPLLANWNYYMLFFIHFMIFRAAVKGVVLYAVNRTLCLL